MKNKTPYFLALLLLILSCKKEKVKKNIPSETTAASVIKYAKGFDIVMENGEKKLIIKSPYKDAEKQFVYTLSNKVDLTKNAIKVPAQRIVVTSTTHVPMVELLGAEKRIKGYPNTKFVSSKRTRKLIDSGEIKELGSEQDINMEMLISVNPDLVVGFAVNSDHKMHNSLQKIGIPIIYNGAWLEQTPLGRAEWIKFFGVLLGLEKKADSVFQKIESEYLKSLKLTEKIEKKPSVISGSLYKDIWYVPAGESFVATYFKEAKYNYIWKGTKGTGSLPLSLETVLDKGKEADYWIGTGLFETKEQLKSANKNYVNFAPYQKNSIYTMATKKGATGGLIYFELSPVRPDLVLKDMIKIANPDLLPDYKLTFFEKMK